MMIGWPQGIWLALTAVGIGVTIAKQTDARDWSIRVIAHVITSCIWAALLYWGGFFGH